MVPLKKGRITHLAEGLVSDIRGTDQSYAGYTLNSEFSNDFPRANPAISTRILVEIAVSFPLPTLIGYLA
jgi:hypothetical protein